METPTVLTYSSDPCVGRAPCAYKTTSSPSSPCWRQLHVLVMEKARQEIWISGYSNYIKDVEILFQKDPVKITKLIWLTVSICTFKQTINSWKTPLYMKQMTTWEVSQSGKENQNKLGKVKCNEINMKRNQNISIQLNWSFSLFYQLFQPNTDILTAYQAKKSHFCIIDLDQNTVKFY